jgi:hypothetical protein
VIISASYKTDIPTFYGEWFMKRLEAGFCRMVNPYNANQHLNVMLDPDHVEGFVFWTKNVGPFLSRLPEIKQRGYPFVVQHTITGYPRELEARVTNWRQTVEHLRHVAATFGPDVVVWRYDPIIITAQTDALWHRTMFAELADALRGTTSEVVVSFAQPYNKMKRNMGPAGAQLGWDLGEHMTFQEDGRAIDLLKDLGSVALSAGMRLTICSQQAFVREGVTDVARCVDAARLDRVAADFGLGAPDLEHATKLKGNREECGCYASRDIGEYDTCPHGCVYCYAVRNRTRALNRFKAHRPDCSYLFAPPEHDHAKDDAYRPVAEAQPQARQPLLWPTRAK